MGRHPKTFTQRSFDHLVGERESTDQGEVAARRSPVQGGNILVAAVEIGRKMPQGLVSKLFLLGIQPPEPLSPIRVVVAQFPAGKTKQTIRL